MEIDTSLTRLPEDKICSAYTHTLHPGSAQPSLPLPGVRA